MVGAFYNGISGIRTHQFGIDSTSNNIANVNTVGYRANLPEFKSLFATSMSYVNANSPISNDYNYGSTIGSNAINANDGFRRTGRKPGQMHPAPHKLRQGQ